MRQLMNGLPPDPEAEARKIMAQRGLTDSDLVDLMDSIKPVAKLLGL